MSNIPYGKHETNYYVWNIRNFKPSSIDYYDLFLSPKASGNNSLYIMER